MSDKRAAVDAFLTSPKSLAAPGSWAVVNRAAERRLRLAILGDIGVSPFELELIVNPDDPARTLRIILLLDGRCVSRLCMADDDHPNTLSRPAHVPAFVSGPHYHGWQENRPKGTGPLPKHLRNALPLPEAVITIDDAFFWFLDNHGIDRPKWGAPSWPARTTLI